VSCAEQPGLAAKRFHTRSDSPCFRIRLSDGRWPLETQYPGKMPVEIDEGVGRPSRWNTLRALRVLRWHEQAGS